MKKDFSRYTIHLNRYYLENWSIGIDFYKVYRFPESVLSATVFQVSFLFFNITLTRWQDKLWTSKNY